jgi:chromosomal replication initiation ATPase DnaA
MALIKTNPIFFPGEENDKREYLTEKFKDLPESTTQRKEFRNTKKVQTMTPLSLKERKNAKPKKESKYEYRDPDVDIIIAEVADYFNFTVGQVIGKRRMRDLVIARWTAYHLIKKYLDITLEYVGFHFSEVDHSSVIHGLVGVDDLINIDRLYTCKLHDLSLNVKSKISNIKAGAKEDITDQFNQEEAYVFYI